MTRLREPINHRMHVETVHSGPLNLAALGDTYRRARQRMVRLQHRHWSLTQETLRRLVDAAGFTTSRCSSPPITATPSGCSTEATRRHTRHTDSPVPRWLVGRDCALSATGAPGGLPNRHRTNRPTTSRASPHLDETCDDRFPVSAQAHAGTCGQTGRPPPLATPMHGDRDAKCVCAGQVRCCFALWSEHGPRYAVKHDPKTHT
jgi:hypothetical protein